MDIDHDMVMVKARDGDDEKKRQFMLASGMNGSALEHSVPEQLFRTPENPVEGISAVKALQIANEQGIPIYTIDRSNISTVLPQLQVDAQVINDIRNAVNAGKEVTVSKTDISYNGWTGCGYIVINPVTGSGGYMISGGMAGAVVDIDDIKVIWFGIATNLILWGPIIMGVGMAVPIAGLALTGAIITGLGAGMVLSQILPEEVKDFILEALSDTSVMIGILTTMSILGISTCLFAVVALLLLYNLYVQTQASINYRFPYYSTKNTYA